jgi:cysteinyl-tRNA synthetase
MDSLHFHNTLSRKKEKFEPINPPFVGMYVCGPTVYGHGHLGHARAAITFDVVFRYLKYLGYKVRYVRNITDVGHLENDADVGDDKIAKRARLEQLEPMEVAQNYTNSYRHDMDELNVLKPSIEPLATGHIIEQQEFIKKILGSGFAYESQGSVYFDVEKYAKTADYGKLSGRVLEDLMNNTRNLDGQSEKQGQLDFALWKKAAPEHIMRWPSPWGEGFPGWHIECSAMSSKYLGETFDIHGGGMDLTFPHHECEIAQHKAGLGVEPAKYWLHNNMVTINGQKMSKSLGNFVNLNEIFTGKNELLERAYSPMTVRYFILQAQYRSTVDFSNDALKAAGKAYNRIINGLRVLKSFVYVADTEKGTQAEAIKSVKETCEACFAGLNDDLNTAIAISHLFNLLKKINAYQLNPAQIGELDEATFDLMKTTYTSVVEDILGLRDENPADSVSLIESLLELYKEYKANKQYDKVDQVRTWFKEQKLAIKDMKSGVTWAYEE